MSVEGVARVIEPGETGREDWVDRYMAECGPFEDALTPEFVRGHLMVEVVPDRAFGIIERTPELSTRATRWTFA